MTKQKTIGGMATFLFVFLLFSFNALAQDECKSKQPVDGVPCWVMIPSDVDCSTISVQFYNKSTLLSTQAMQNYSSFICAANFTYSSLGVYNFNYSTGDSGVITVTEGNQMISLLFFGMVLIAGLLFLGFSIHNNWVVALGSMGMLTIGYWIFKNGFSAYQNVLTDGIGTILIGMGGYFLIMSMLSEMEG